jgi:hypothetical protein
MGSRCRSRVRVPSPVILPLRANVLEVPPPETFVGPPPNVPDPVSVIAEPSLAFAEALPPGETVTGVA